ncbi:hypothetical protein ALC57_12424 [Trachymyrmex cornetzi]|uniref:Uncharacterized protein n=1 Tax=Trachymyrmex cornetzi TaxID=471704 RepID=A0A195DR36_9HYME|nr:hypothetical protein ALC57_12424 [Trachymyrmex cornetzi]
MSCDVCDHPVAARDESKLEPSRKREEAGRWEASKRIRVSLKRAALRREATPWVALGGPSLAPKSGARVIFDCRGETTDE